MLLLTFDDVDIYERDLNNFQDGCWLNDSCINYCFRKFDRKYSNHKLVLMDPTVVSFLLIQASDEEDLEELYVNLQIDKRTWLLAPLTNRETFSEASTHWSLLLCHICSGKFFHFDSSGSYNETSSIRVANKIAQLIKK